MANLPKPFARSALMAIFSPENGLDPISLTREMAMQLSREGHRVIVIDADEGRLLSKSGITAKHTLSDVLRDECPVGDAKYVTPEGLTLTACGEDGLEPILGLIAALSLSYDWAIVMAAPGCTPAHVRLAQAADESLMLFDGRGDRFMRAYWMLDAVRARTPRFDPLMIGRGEPEETREAYDMLTSTVREFLGAPPSLASILAKTGCDEDHASEIAFLMSQNEAFAKSA